MGRDKNQMKQHTQGVSVDQAQSFVTLALSKMLIKSNKWIEIILIGFAALLYSFPLLNFQPGLGPSGNEYQIHTGVSILLKQWLAGETDFPLWNPIVGTGRSLIADPFLFLFNPFLSLPMVLMGVVNGSKVAIGLNFFIAGTGMWVLVNELKLGRVSRIWCSLLYMMSGAIPAHLTTGHLQLAFALGWLPWSIAAFLWVLHHSSFLAMTLAAIAQALFFFTGNLYYQVYTFFCLLLLSLFFAIEWKNLSLNKKAAVNIFLLGLVSLGLIAIQALPEIAMRKNIHNMGGYGQNETEFGGSQKPEYAFINYFVSDQEFYRNGTLNKAAFLQESYHFIGIAPILLLLFLVPAYQKGRRREILAFGACFLLMLAWAGLRYTFIKNIYHTFPMLYQFRWPGRALSVGALFLILLSGYSLDYLWNWLHSDLRSVKLPGFNGAAAVSLRPSSVAQFLLLIGLGLSINHVYKTNKALIYLERISQPEVKSALKWLRSNDPEEFSVQATFGAGLPGIFEFYKLGIRSPNIVDGWFPAAAYLPFAKADLINYQPKYWLQWQGEEVALPDANLIRQFGQLQIWKLTNFFPYAFHVPLNKALETPQFTPNDVLPVLRVQREGHNQVVVDVVVQEESILVLSESWFSGWEAFIDQKSAELLSASNLLSVQLTPGSHHVLFVYNPISFKVGAFLSAFTLLLLVGIVLSEQIVLPIIYRVRQRRGKLGLTDHSSTKLQNRNDQGIDDSEQRST